MLLNDIPDVILGSILSFTGGTNDLLRCERTCKRLHNLLRTVDSIWRSCPNRGLFENIQTYRESACFSHARKLVRKVQISGLNIILDVLGVRRWKKLVNRTLIRLLPADLIIHRFYSLRGDTSAVLIEMVENFAVSQLSRANTIMLSFPQKTRVYPSVNRRHYEVQHELLGHGGPGKYSCYKDERLSATLSYTPVGGLTEAEVIEFANTLVDPLDRDRIVRNIAFRAGIIKLGNEMYNVVWAGIIHQIAWLLHPACLELFYMSEDPQIHNKKRALASNESMRDVVPYPCRIGVCEYHGEFLLFNTIVPKQIEDAARRLAIPSKVYGDDWHVSESTQEQEMAAAEAAYEFTEDDGADWFTEQDTDAKDDKSSTSDSGEENGEMSSRKRKRGE